MVANSSSSRWLARFGKSEPKRSERALSLQGIDSARSVQIGRQHYVFVMDWRLFASRADLSKSMRSAHKQGYTHCLTISGDMVGFAIGLDRKMTQKPFSAAIHMAESISEGGIEMFIFKFPDGQYSLTVLNDSRPVPQFDQMGSLEEVKSMVSEYKALQTGQDIRYVGNTDLFEGMEQLSLNDAFSAPEPVSALKKLPNYTLRLQLLLVLVPLVLLVGAVVGWLHWHRQAEERERLAQSQDPNFKYEQVADSSLRQLGAPAAAMLAQWRSTISSVPIERAGWKLEKIVCQSSACTANWLREAGSFQDFKSIPLEGVGSITETQNGDNPAKATIETVFPFSLTAPERNPLARSELPILKQAMQLVTSQLQDISLLDDVKVKLNPPELFPATGASPDQLARPVVRGEWSITHELWSLGELELPFAAQVLTGLTIQQDEKTKNWTYTLTGHYYAKGKNY